jgi:hypothetical protein
VLVVGLGFFIQAGGFDEYVVQAILLATTGTVTFRVSRLEPHVQQTHRSDVDKKLQVTMSKPLARPRWCGAFN